jgi:hypothetical protein
MAYLQVLPLGGSRDKPWWGQGIRECSVLEFSKTESIVTVQWRFWTKYLKCICCDGSPYHTHEMSPRHWKPASQQTLLPLVTAGNPCRIVIVGIQRLQQLQPVFFRAKMFVQNATDTWLKHLQFPACTLCWLLRVPDKSFSYMLDSLSWWPWLACSFCSAQAATLLEFLSPLMNCFVCMWFCVVLGPKSPLHHHNWLSFGKFWDTERFLIPCPCHVSSQLLPSGETCKYAMAPIIQTNLERLSTYWSAPFCCVCLGCCAAEFEVSKGLMNYHV